MRWRVQFGRNLKSLTNLPEPLLRLDDSDSNGIPHQAGDVVNPQAVHQLFAMSFDCFDADVENACNVLGAFSFTDQLQDFALTRSELLFRIPTLAHSPDIVLD